ncbi:hypothetical protein A176_000777 [Myxococcus hansupus]|uniref:Uncharacterized protein n=1 Tax=Pseudomyxococcus hansupus TaxID=1297742 RepID=A0A0H4WR77_9BACT|nr:hypothetical protein A176_000777 [Myxococcus hansupus]
MTVGVVLLAEHGSSRREHPRQCVRYQGKTPLQPRRHA